MSSLTENEARAILAHEPAAAVVGLRIECSGSRQHPRSAWETGYGEASGECPICGRVYRLRANGRVRVHLRGGSPC